MKKIFLVLACLLVAAVAAAAQENLTFADLPLMSSPAPMPNGYGGLNWTNIYYVDPGEWPGSGPGYKDRLLQGVVRSQDVAFVGGRLCRLYQEACYGTISSAGGPIAFQAVSAVVAGGFGSTSFTVTAFNNGKYIGSAFYTVDTQMHSLHFPDSWGAITQLTFQTPGGGDLVFYDVQVYLLGG